MSFRLKTVLGIALIEIVLLAILVFSGLHYIETSNAQRLVDQARVSARLLATMTTDATVSLDLATLDELVVQAIENPGIVYARIRDAEGRVLAQAPGAEVRSADFIADDSIESAQSDGVFDVATDISISGHAFGHVELGLDIGQLAVTVDQAREWMLTIAGAEILLVAGFGLLLGHVLMRQLVRLQNAAARVSEGDFGATIVVTGRDELAETARSFNRMSLSLEDYKSKAEAALAAAEAGRLKAEARLYDAVESMPQGVAIFEADGAVMHLNRSFLELYDLGVAEGMDGRSAAELVELQFTSIGNPALPEEAAGASNAAPFDRQRQMQRFAEPEANPWWETRLCDKRIVLSNLKSLPDGGLVLVDTDVTDLHEAAMRNQEMERELLKKQKLESLGTLAGGVAHEINTPAQFVGDNLEFAREAIEAFAEGITSLGNELEKLGQAERLAEVLDEHDLPYLMEETPVALSQSTEGINRIRDIVKAVKVYTHPGCDEMRAIDINEAVRTAVTVTSNNWKHVARVDFQLAEDLPAIPLNEGQIGQVLVNLIVNAADALEETSDREKVITLATRKVGTNLEISVADNGPGIPEELRDRVFDPFFTTKEVGRGTGQGLAICRSIICDKHNGQVQVENHPCGGAEFRILMPIDGEGAPAAGAGSDSEDGLELNLIAG